jgi:NDP-sugar pyrophosphorylase family protein
MHADTRLKGFREKGSAQRDSFHNAGIYVFDRSVLSRIPAECPSSIETDLLPGLLAQGLYGYVTESSLFDIGTPERLTQFRTHVESLAPAAMAGASASPDRRRPRS